MNPGQDPQEKIREYFNRESAEYCAYYDLKVKLTSIVRNTSRLLFQSAIKGRRDAVIALCPEPISQLKICEVGSGGGHYAIELARRGANVLGLDFAPKMVAKANEAAAKEGLSHRCRFEEANIFYFNSKKKFDVVFAAGVIDYVPPTHHQKLIEEMASLSNRYIIVSFPKKFHYHAFARKIWLTLKGVPVWFFTSDEMVRVLQAGGTTPDKPIDVGILKVIRAKVS